jgi:hypothetical protein
MNTEKQDDDVIITDADTAAEDHNEGGGLYPYDSMCEDVENLLDEVLRDADFDQYQRQLATGSLARILNKYTEKV